MNTGRLIADLKAGKLDPVYVLAGNEQWSRRKIIDALTRTVVDPSMADFNFERHSGKETKGRVVVDAAGTLPMMAERRLVIVDETEKWLKADWDALKAYAADPSESTCLLIDLGSAKLRPWMNSLKTVTVIKVPRPKPWELADFIAQLAADQSLTLSREASEMLAEYAGDELEKVERDLEVLAIYKGGDGRIEGEDVAALLGRTRTVTQWELNELIGSRDLAGALIKTGDILASGHEPIALLAVLVRYVHQLWQVKALITAGVRQRTEIAQAIGLPPRVAGDLMTQQRRFSNVELRQAYQRLAASDVALKSSRLKRDLILSAAVTKLIHRERFAPPTTKRT